MDLLPNSRFLRQEIQSQSCLWSSQTCTGMYTISVLEWFPAKGANPAIRGLLGAAPPRSVGPANILRMNSVGSQMCLPGVLSMVWRLGDADPNHSTYASSFRKYPNSPPSGPSLLLCMREKSASLPREPPDHHPLSVVGKLPPGWGAGPHSNLGHQPRLYHRSHNLLSAFTSPPGTGEVFTPATVEGLEGKAESFWDIALALC